MKALDGITAPLRARLAPLQAWLNQREPREQLALHVLAIALALTMLLLLVWQPLVNNHADAKAQFIRNSQLHAWIADNSAAVRGAAQRTPTARAGNADWIAQLSRSASTAGLELRGFSPEGEQAVRIQLEAQPFAELVNWLQKLEAEQDIRVTQAEFSATSASGLVNLRATLKR